MSEYQDQLSEVKQFELNIWNAEQDFNQSISNLNDFYKRKEDQDLRILNNPNLINEEVQVRKELFSKLKFQYIEQETKEKFLRAILDTPPLFIEQSDILEIEEKLKNLKINLKAKKNESLQFDVKIEQLSKDLIIKNDKFNNKLRETEILIDDINRMESTIADLSRENWNNNANDLLKIYELLHTSNEIYTIGELEQEINNRSAELANLKEKVSNLTNEINTNQLNLSSLNSKIGSLDERAKETQSLINSQNQFELDSNLMENSKITEKKNIGTWLNEMCKIWCKISNIAQIDIKNQDNDKEIELILKSGHNVNLVVDKVKHIKNYRLSWALDPEKANRLLEIANFEKDPVSFFIVETTKFL